MSETPPPAAAFRPVGHFVLMFLSVAFGVVGVGSSVWASFFWFWSAWGSALFANSGSEFLQIIAAVAAGLAPWVFAITVWWRLDRRPPTRLFRLPIALLTLMVFGSVSNIVAMNAVLR